MALLAGYSPIHRTLLKRSSRHNLGEIKLTKRNSKSIGYLNLLVFLMEGLYIVHSQSIKLLVLADFGSVSQLALFEQLLQTHSCSLLMSSLRQTYINKNEYL